jgi:hypothetical protein
MSKEIPSTALTSSQSLEKKDLIIPESPSPLMGFLKIFDRFFTLIMLIFGLLSFGHF